VYPHQRLVFLDPGVPHHPPSLPGFLSRVAEDHRRAGTPVIWLRSDRAWGIPRGDVTLDVPDPTADPHALSGTWDPLSTTALARTLAVVEIMAQRRVPAAHCFAYGDLCLDESVLAVVGNPRVVACCPKQAEYARSRGFAVIGTLPR
jgi:hypothetical protein